MFLHFIVSVCTYVCACGGKCVCVWGGGRATFDDATKMRSDIDEYIEDSVMRILYSV